MSEITLYDYWRSSASYRLRIALNLLKLDHKRVVVNLLEKEHLSEEHRHRNPQGFVPALNIDGVMMTQSVAILEYLNSKYEDACILPADALDAHYVRALCHVIAMDIHPVCNLSVVKYAVEQAGGDAKMQSDWMVKFISRGLAAFETMLTSEKSGKFCFGDTPSMADICLMPQIYNARRWGASLDEFSKIRAIVEQCEALDAFKAALPETIGAD